MEKKAREPYMWEGIAAILILVVVLAYSLGKLKVDTHIPFVIVIALTSLLAIRMGHTWDNILQSILESLSSVLQAMIILIMVGMVIGTWVQGGIVPSLVYYGLLLIEPRYFLVTVFLVCSICAVATGSSWTIIGTLGAAAIGISEGLSIPPYITAGIVVCTGYFGDKLSPLSDTPNLHCAVVGVNLFENFKNVLRTTIPAYLLGLLLCVIVGFRYSWQQASDMQMIRQITEALDARFVIRPWLILPVLLVFVMVFLKIPAIPGIFLMSLTGALCGFFVQRGSLADVINAAYSGYVGNTGVELVDSLLTRGGILSMLPTALLILCAVAYSGVLKVSGILRLFVQEILKHIKKTEALISVTVISCVLVNLIAMDNYVTAVMIGSMFRDAYVERGLHPMNLTRCLAESASVVSPLIPWNTCGIVVFGMLGISPLQYAPYAFLCWISPVMVIVLTYCKKGVVYLKKEESVPMQESPQISVDGQV